MAKRTKVNPKRTFLGRAKKMKEKCEHEWVHLETTARSCNLKDKKPHKFLVHICKKCGVETTGMLIYEENKK